MYLKIFLSILFLYYFGTILVLSDEEIDYCLKEENCTDQVNSQKLDVIVQLKNKSRYDYTRIYQVHINTELQEERLKDFANFTDVAFLMDHNRDSNTRVNVFIPANKVGDFESLMRTYSFKFKIVNYNFQLTINDNLEGLIYEYAHNRFFDWEHYFNLHAIHSWMDELVSKYPNIVKVLHIGNGTEGLPIKGIQLDFTKGNRDNNTAVVIEGGIYADQWITTATATYFINKLLTSEDPVVRRTASNFTWFIFPTINPDGYEYTMTSDRMWRKNRRNFGICRGVNLNRNFPFLWKTVNPSNNPCHTNFEGPHAASEVETRLLMQFLIANKQTERIRTYIALDSFSQLVLYPFSAKSDSGGHELALRTLAYRAKLNIYDANNESMYESGSTFTWLNPYSGSSLDWVHGYLNIPIALTLELPGPHDNIEEYFVPAKKIEPTASDAFVGLMQILKDARTLGYYNVKYARRGRFHY